MKRLSQLTHFGSKLNGDLGLGVSRDDTAQGHKGVGVVVGGLGAQLHTNITEAGAHLKQAWFDRSVLRISRPPWGPVAGSINVLPDWVRAVKGSIIRSKHV